MPGGPLRTLHFHPDLPGAERARRHPALGTYPTIHHDAGTGAPAGRRWRGDPLGQGPGSRLVGGAQVGWHSRWPYEAPLPSLRLLWLPVAASPPARLRSIPQVVQLSACCGLAQRLGSCPHCPTGHSGRLPRCLEWSPPFLPPGTAHAGPRGSRALEPGQTQMRCRCARTDSEWRGGVWWGREGRGAGEACLCPTPVLPQPGPGFLPISPCGARARPSGQPAVRIPAVPALWPPCPPPEASAAREPQAT